MLILNDLARYEVTQFGSQLNPLLKQIGMKKKVCFSIRGVKRSKLFTPSPSPAGKLG